MTKNLTLGDIAKIAGVSPATVSRVINDHPNVRDEVRQRVNQAIQDTGYHPNAAARTLASQRSWTIGLVLPHSVSYFFTDPFYPHLTQGVAQMCNQLKYTLALFLVGSKEDEELIFPRIARKGFVDGVIIQSGHHGDQEIIRKLDKSGMPHIVVGRPFHTEGVSYIDIDNTNSAYNAVSHLYRLGRRRIATITGPDNSTVGIDRTKGYKEALVNRRLPIDDSLIAEGDFTDAGGYYTMQKLLLAKPDAVFASSDVMALGAIRAVREAGLRVPEDIAFVGFDDLPIATMTDMKLTTIRQPVNQCGNEAVALLVDIINNGNNSPRHIILDTELIIRDSCGANLRK